MTKPEKIRQLDKTLDRLFYGTFYYLHVKFHPSKQEIEDNGFRYDSSPFFTSSEAPYLYFGLRHILPIFHEYELILNVGTKAEFRFKSLDKFIEDVDKMINEKSYPTMSRTTFNEEGEPVELPGKMISPPLTLELLCDDKYIK